MNRIFLRLAGCICLISAMASHAASLTDYGAEPALAKPQGDQLSANQKLDFHTDLYTGRFAYSVPVEVPPARDGATPGVALEYNSANKNGWCGVGWDLDMGNIQRETRRGVPVSGSSYSDSFGFTFSAAGQSGRLIKVAGTNDYRPQIDSAFLKFSYSNASWVVTDKGGRKFSFGETTNSRMTNSWGTFKWALSSIRDPNGNQTLLSYTNISGQLYLKEIDYNGNTNSPAISTNCAVAFDLETTNRSDISSSLISGSEVQTTRRLSAIRVLSQGQLVRRYQLQYTYSSSTSRSLLQKVTEFGSDNTSSLPARTFSYQAQSASFASASAWSITPETGAGIPGAWSIAPGNQDQQLVDIDGDGLPDWVTLDNNSAHSTFSVQLNTGSGFGSQQSWSLNNDGSDTTRLWNDPDSSLSPGGSGLTAISQLTDINGDGIADRVMRQYSGGPNYSYFQVQTNTGTGFYSSVAHWTGVNSASANFQGALLNTPSAMTSGGEASLAMLVDINGDGLPDRVMVGSSSGQFDVQLNSTNGSFSSLTARGNVVGASASSLDTYYYAARVRDTSGNVYSEFMDLNGDGLPDRVIANGVQLNNGVNGFGSSVSWGYSGNPEAIDISGGRYTTQLIDMNGDGLPDFVQRTSTTTYSVYFNTGRGFSSTAVTWTGVDPTGDGTAGWDAMQAWDANGTKVMFIDMDGDGLPDRVIRDYNLNSDILVQLNNGPYPDLLITASNGIGGSVSITYVPSTSYNNSDGTRPRLQFPVYTVSSLTTSDGRGNSAMTTYNYTNGLYDATYREFRGFGVVRETDPLNAFTVTWFHQGGGTNGSSLGEFNDDLAKAGMAYRVEHFGSDNKLYTRSLNKVDEVKLHTNGVFFPFVRQTITEDFEGNAGATAYRATAVGYAYNAVSNNLASSACNLIAQTNYGEVISVNIANHTFTTTNSTAPFYKQFSYATIPSNPDIIDRVAVSTISADSSGSVILRQTTNGYYDVTGDLKTKADLICPGTFGVTSYGYDVYGNLISTTNPVGVVQTTDYDTTTATYPVRKYTGSLSDNLIEYTLFDTRSGRMVAATNLAGLVTSNAYDAFFRLTNSAISTTANGAPTLTRTKYEYKLGGISSGGVSTNFIHVLQNDPSDPSGFHETYSYFDGLGRIIQARLESETSNQYRVTDLVYDDRGSVVLQSYPTFGTNPGYGKLPAASRTNYVYTEYDPIGRTFRINPCAKATFTSGGILSGNPVAIAGDSGSPAGPTSIAFKDGTNPWAVIVTNALGKIHKYYLDAFGRTNQIVEVTSQGNFTSLLAYDQVGDLTNITDSASNQFSFFYNLVGQKVAEADPDRGFWQYGLDAAGRLKVQTDAKNQQIKFFYDDPAGRLTRREGWNASGTLVSVMTNKYDSNFGDGSYAVYPGQLFAVYDDEGWQKNSYDVRGRTLKTARYLSKNGNTYTSQFTFDDADRISSVIYPNGGPTVTDIFDTGENLAKVQRVDAGGTNIVYYTPQGFDELDRLTGINFGNGAATTFNYYKVSRRLNQITTTIPGSTTIQNFTNRYDAVGNIIGLQDIVAAHTGGASATISSASYDDLNRLTGAVWAGYGSQSYAYDSVGNVLTNTESGSLQYKYYSLRPHSVTNANGNWFTYDRNGNIVYRGSQRLDYDVNNRLFRVSTNSTTTTFGYAGEGTRLWELNGTNSLQVWIGDIYEERDGKVLFHIAAAGRRICTFEPAAGGVTGYNASTQEFYYYHPDYLTSSSLLTERNGTQVQHYEYSAFGQSRYAQSSTAFHVSRRYTGQVLDEGTGLYYYNFRYYDALLGRFVQPDDIIPDTSDPQSYNRYSYVLNNPLRFTDPSGHSWYDYIPGIGPGLAEFQGNQALNAMAVRLADQKGTALASKKRVRTNVVFS